MSWSFQERNKPFLGRKLREERGAERERKTSCPLLSSPVNWEAKGSLGMRSWFSAPFIPEFQQGRELGLL